MCWNIWVLHRPSPIFARLPYYTNGTCLNGLRCRFLEVSGQEHMRAFEIAAAGGHNRCYAAPNRKDVLARLSHNYT